MAALEAGFLTAPSGPLFTPRRDTKTLGLRVDARMVDWYNSCMFIARGKYQLPDGVLPAAAMEILRENINEIIRRAVKQTHNVDIMAPYPDE